MPTADLTSLLKPFLTSTFKADVQDQSFDFSDILELQVYLEQQKKCRKTAQEQVTILCLAESNETYWGYFLSPFISSTLKYKTHFVAKTSQAIQDIYAHYFRIDALTVNHTHAIQDMDLCLDLVSVQQNLAHYSLWHALRDARCKQVITLGEVFNETEKHILQVYDIKVVELGLTPHRLNNENVIWQQLFWKRKDEINSALCQQLTALHIPLIQQLTQLQEAQVERLIDDLMYGEHLLEKVSVFGEFTETMYKHQLKA